MKYSNIPEEELKNKITQDFFSKFDCTKILGKIDFAVKVKRPENTIDFDDEFLLWAEAKQKSTGVIEMLAQLVLTIGKARTFDEILPPPFLGCYDYEKIAFVPYADIQDIFYQNDFNWKVAPSDAKTSEFKQVYAQIEKIINDRPWETYIFDFEKDEKELKKFIQQNFIAGKTETSKIRIDKNNFIIIYNKWLDAVKPTIRVDWNNAKKKGIIDGYFYLADLLSAENKTLKEKLFVVLKTDHYELDREIDDLGFFGSKKAQFTDNQKAHNQFWAKYERPPLEEYWNYIVDRQDLLVPQDIRERKGSFYTPKIWVELSQKYLADVFGADWQDEYYIWDCAAGTGNLLAGLTNKYNIWASTLDKADVDVMKDRIQNGANLLENNVFQFDFLNDDFTKLPQDLQEIINDPKLRKKLIVYINPPYAEAASKKTLIGVGDNKTDVAVASKIYNNYLNSIGIAGRELFAQFLIRIFSEIPSCKIANFSKIKNILAPNFSDFRTKFQAKLEKLFVVPSDTFDNVKGKFPIGFFIWDTNIREPFNEIISNIYDNEGKNAGTKYFSSYDGLKSINDWLISTRNRNGEMKIGFISCKGSDFQTINLNFIVNDKNILPHPRGSWITNKNLIEVCIYFAVRKAIPATWLNDRDHFLYPNNKWKKDLEFQNDCIAYTLFSNNISTKFGVNHWIPFSEKEADASGKFKSHFMQSFISGKIIQNRYSDLFAQEEDKSFIKREFSPEAQAVFETGKNLWRYYHKQPKCNVNASLYDIREHFQGRNEKGKMNNKSSDETYNGLIGNLRSELKLLAKKIEPKVYEYGFLRG